MKTSQGTSPIHDDWSKVQKAIGSLSDKTLDDCVKRLNESVFNKLSIHKSSKIDISMETFDKIMNEIDDDVKTQENKNNPKTGDIGKERRQFISEPVIFGPFFLTFVLF